MSTPKHWMIWDGECGLCSHTAQWVRKKDTSRLFQIVTYQNTPRPPMTDAIYETCKSQMVVITSDGRQINGALGILFVLQELGWGGFAKLLTYPPIVWPIKIGYWLVARNRGVISKWFFGGTACGLDNRYPEVD